MRLTKRLQLSEMKSSIYAVIDTNVLVSALISKRPDSFPLTVIEQVYTGLIVPVINDEILAEYEDVLHRDKFNLEAADINTALITFIHYGLNVNRTPLPNVKIPDPKDRVFYEVKASCPDAYLITGNIRHFPTEPSVVTPREMVNLLQLLPL